MKKICFILLLSNFSLIASAQFVAIADIKEDIEGICDKKKVYALLEMFGDQKEAQCSVSDPEIEKMLNEKVVYLAAKPGITDKGMVSLIINCKGEVVSCKIDNETKSPVLDAQVVDVFKTLKSWKAGTLDGKKVDSLKLWSFEITNSKLVLK